MLKRNLAHYEIVEKVGEGGMGEVYRARDTRLGRDVALKLLPPDVAGDPARRARFEREARAVAGLQHPNIVTLHSIEDADGVYFITMEFVEGKTLSAEIGDGGLPLERFFDLAVPLADALASAHAKGIVHRDLKPANIMRDATGRLKILDFGLAKLFDVDPETDETVAASADSMTGEGHVVGTVAYMSPEQAEGEAVDARSDVFALGIVLYEMATGKHPFQGKTQLSTLSAILRDEPRSVTELRPVLPRHLGRIIAHCMAKEPERRYQSALDVRNELERLRAEVASGDLERLATSTSARVPAAAVRSRARRIAAGVVGVLIVSVAAFALVTRFRSPEPSVGTDRPMVAVLPFENMGPTDDEYFADGITEEITSRLATITGLGVISRTSTMRYKGTAKSLAEIAAELNVAYVLQGSIRWDKSQRRERVRITPQLIRVSDDTHVWAHNYERELERIFEVQADIATQIAAALEVTLLEKDRSTLTTVPTENTEAYMHYLRGHEYAEDGTAFTTGLLDKSIAAFTRAVEIDPDFAIAWAWLAICHSNYYHNGIDRTPARLERAKQCADRALVLQPDHPDTRLAMAYYHYWGRKDYDTAMTWVGGAAELRSGDAEISQLFGWILRRLGRYEEAIERLRESLVLAPRDRGVVFGLGECYLYQGQLEEANEQFLRASAMDPGAPLNHWYLSWGARLAGDMGESRRVLDSYTGNDRDIIPYAWYEHHFFAREFDQAVRVLERSSRDSDSHEAVVYPNTLHRGLARLAQGDTARARADLDAAQKTLQRLIEERPDDHRLYSSLGLAQAGLGQAEAAVANGRKSVAMYPMSKDRYGGTWRLIELAQVYALAGYVDEALEQIDELLTLDTYVTTHWFRLNPNFDGIRGDPRFQAVLTRHGRSA